MNVFPTTLAESSPAAPPAEAAKSAVFAFTPDRLRAWGLMSVLSLTDQALTSAAGLTVNLLLARWLSADLYGAFAVAFAGFLFVAGFHNVLLLEPLSVIGPARHATNLRAYFRAQLTVHVILVGALSLVALAAGIILWRVLPGSPLVGSVLGSALMLSLLLLLWLVRRMCYVMQRPALAVAGSAFYLLFVIAGLVALRSDGWISGLSVFLLMGCGSLLASGIIILRLRVVMGDNLADARLRWQTVLCEDWTYGRWLVGSAILYSIANQAQIFLLPVFLGLGAAGILRAMQLPSLVMTQVIAATGLLVLPSLSYDFGRRAIKRMQHKVALVSLSLSCAAILFVVLLALIAGRAEHALFGGKYAAYAWLMPVLALAPAASAVSTGYSMALRASQKPQFDLISNAFAAPIAILSVLLFMRFWGLGGAVASMVVSVFVVSIVTIVCFRFTLRRRSAGDGGA